MERPTGPGVMSGILVAGREDFAGAPSGGRIDLKKLNFIQKRMIGMVKAPVWDSRDWDAIGKWARGNLPGKFGV
jgi:hypothetical protein